MLDDVARQAGISIDVAYGILAVVVANGKWLIDSPIEIQLMSRL